MCLLQFPQSPGADLFISLRRRARTPFAWLFAPYGAARSRALRAAARPGPDKGQALACCRLTGGYPFVASSSRLIPAKVPRSPGAFSTNPPPPSPLPPEGRQRERRHLLALGRRPTPSRRLTAPDSRGHRKRAWPRSARSYFPYPSCPGPARSRSEICGFARGWAGLGLIISLNRRARTPFAWLSRHTARRAVARSGPLTLPIHFPHHGAAARAGASPFPLRTPGDESPFAWRAGALTVAVAARGLRAVDAAIDGARVDALASIREKGGTCSLAVGTAMHMRDSLHGCGRIAGDERDHTCLTYRDLTAQLSSPDRSLSVAWDGRGLIISLNRRALGLFISLRRSGARYSVRLPYAPSRRAAQSRRHGPICGPVPIRVEPLACCRETAGPCRPVHGFADGARYC